MSRRGSVNRATKEQYWRDAVQRWRQSELSVRDFCAAEDLSEQSFYWWRRTLAARDQHRAATTPARATRAAKQPLFVPVGLVPTTTLELVLGGDRTIRVPAGFDSATLRQLLAVLEEPSC
jgi:hypothetical protein